MHYGIAKFIAENSSTDEETAKAWGVSLAVVRQAKVRHTLLLNESVQEPSARVPAPEQHQPFPEFRDGVRRTLSTFVVKVSPFTASHAMRSVRSFLISSSPTTRHSSTEEGRSNREKSSDSNFLFNPDRASDMPMMLQSFNFASVVHHSYKSRTLFQGAEDVVGQPRESIPILSKVPLQLRKIVHPRR